MQKAGRVALFTVLPMVIALAAFGLWVERVAAVPVLWPIVVGEKHAFFVTPWVRLGDGPIEVVSGEGSCMGGPYVRVLWWTYMQR